jgi:feruloyl-CoA synthase
MIGMEYRNVEFFSPAVTVTPSGNNLLMSSDEPLGAFDRCVGKWLERWARISPHRKFIVEQSVDGEKYVDYCEAFRRVLLLAEGLLALQLGAERPVVVLSRNCIEHALFMLAALHVGVPVAPIAPAHALQTSDHTKLLRSIRLLTPGLVMVEDGEAYRVAIESLRPLNVRVMAFRNPLPGMEVLENLYGDGSGQTRVMAAFNDVHQETIAKFLFTSGSTGVPKAVINTHRMLCSSAQMMRQIAPFLACEPPIMVDWLPWNHTAGGNCIFNIVLYHGGTLYIDPGNPTPDEIAKSVALLRKVSPTIYFNVPMGYDALISFLEADAELNARFFQDLRFLWYAAAAIQPSTWAALQRLALAALGRGVLLVSGLGMTETSPLALFGNWGASAPGVVGIPAPGVEVKLIRHEEQFEIRYRGPNVTPGYWRDAAATCAAFDDERFFRSGDLVAFVDPRRPERGVTFEGRLSEDFKLSSGTKVAAGALRLAALSKFGPLVRDIVVAGEGRDEVRLLIFPDWAACARALALSPALEPSPLASEPRVVDLFRLRLSEVTREGTGSSNRVVAAILVQEPPLVAAGEITEKGTINSRGLLKNRPALLEALYTDDNPSVIFGNP